MLPLKEGTGAVWPRTGLPTKHNDIGALQYRGWVRDHNRLAPGKPATRTVHRSWLSFPSLDLAYRIR